MPEQDRPQEAPMAPWQKDGPTGPEAREGASMAQEEGVSVYLTRDAILAAPDLAVVNVEVPEWGGVVRVRALSGAERDAFEASCMREKADGKTEFDARNMRAKLVALCLVDAQGRRIFGQEDVTALGRKSARALSRVFDAAAKLNGLSADDVASLEGNSDGQGGDSSSALPWPSDEQ